jgi:hypothetical protein
MFPLTFPHSDHLQSYNLHLNPLTRSHLFEKLVPNHIVSLRLSGNCILPERAHLPRLRHLIMNTVTGNHFDLRTFDSTFGSARLELFSYNMGDRLGFELRDSHLKSLGTPLGQNLRKLVLLGCSRFSDAALYTLFEQLHELVYLALDLIIVYELQYAFIRTVSLKLQVLKFAATYARHSLPRIEEENLLCEEIEALMCRETPPWMVCLQMREEVLRTAERLIKWPIIAVNRGIDLRLGDWREYEEV